MTEITNTPSTTPNQEQASTTASIYAPRSALLEFILTFFTFSISASFWLVARVREVNSLSSRKFTPWLWFFVPAFFIVQFVALPKLFREMDHISKAHGAQILGAWKWGLLSLFVVSTAFMSISEKIEFSQWAWFIALTMYSFCIATLQHRFNQIKTKLETSNQIKIKYVYKAWEWVLLIIGTPLMLFVIYTSVLTPLLTTTKDISNGTTLIYPEQPFQVTVLDDGWREVELGTFSDGTAEIELGGPLNSMYFIVFKHGLNTSLSSVSYWRQGNIIEENANNKCTQVRSFEKETIDVSALVICEGRSLNDPTLTVSKTIQTDQGIYEIFGYLNSTRISFARHKANFIAMAKGFKAL